jgi:hypothetical protein
MAPPFDSRGECYWLMLTRRTVMPPMPAAMPAMVPVVRRRSIG